MATPKGPRKKAAEAADSVREALLENPTRRQIRDLIEKKPGMNRSQIAKRLGIKTGAVVFHLKRMAEVGLVELRPGTQRDEMICFTPRNINLWDKRPTRILYGHRTSCRIALYLTEHPGATTNQVAEALELSKHAVRVHTRKLADSGLIQKVRIDKAIQHHARPVLMEWVEEVRKSGDEEKI